jgi:hypothetical protein
MASVILVDKVEVEHVVLKSDRVLSRRSRVRFLRPEMVRLDAHNQVRTVQLPEDVAVFWRLLAALRVMP